MTESSEGANLANTILGLKKFDGRNPAEFKTWMKKLCVVISVICVTGFTDNYKDVKMMMYRDPSFDVDQMQTTMRHMFLDELSRNGTKGRIAGRDSVMTAVTSEQDIICYWCKNRGHSKKDCPKFKSRTKPAGAAKWCSVHRTTTHRNEECYSQGATRPTKNARVSLACTNCRHCTSADSNEPTVDNTEPSHSDKPVINFAGSSDDFDGGFMYAAGMPGRFTPGTKGATLLVDSGVGILPRRQAHPGPQHSDARI